MGFFGTLAKTKPQNFIKEWDRRNCAWTGHIDFYQEYPRSDKTSACISTSNKKSPLHHLRGFARKNTAITGKIYEKIEWRTFNYRVHNSNQLHNKLDFLSWMHSCKARPWLAYPRLKVKRFNTWVMQISIKAPSLLWLYGAQLNYLLG